MSHRRFRIPAVLMAAVLCLSLFVPAVYADEPGADPGNGEAAAQQAEILPGEDDPAGAEAADIPAQEALPVPAGAKDPLTGLSDEEEEAILPAAGQEGQSPAGETLTDTVEEEAEGAVLAEAITGDCGENLTWKLDNSVLTISGTGRMYDFMGWSPWSYYSWSITQLVIENGVESISPYAFYQCGNIQSVTIPESCLSVGAFAFQDCSGLKEVTIYGRDVEESAFIQCRALETVTLGPKVRTLGISAFETCPSLSRVNISDLSAYCSIYFGGMHASPLEYAKNLYLNGSLVTNLRIPNGIKEVPDYAFMNGKCFTSITIPKSVKKLGDYSFYGCGNAKTISLPEGLTSIGANAFNGCTGARGVSIPSTVSYIGALAFCGVVINPVTVQQGVIGQLAFMSTGATGEVTLGGGITYIGEEAFKGCLAVENDKYTLNYTGSRAQWQNTRILDGNQSLNTRVNKKGFTSTARAEVDLSEPGTLTAGDSVQLGTWGGGSSPLMWTVLDVQDGRALLVSREVLAFEPFYEHIWTDSMSWAQSDVRTWLNGDFMAQAFSVEDRARILETEVVTENNPVYGTSGGEAVTDSVFLLSAEEAERYFAHDDERTAYAAEGLSSHGIHPTTKKAYYWLRTPGINSYSFMYVSYEGSCRLDGAADANGIFGVRPAMWVSTEGLNFTDRTLPLDAVKAFVQRLYRICFNRTADQGGLSNWVSQLINETKTAAVVAQGFFMSQEMKNLNLSDEDFVECCYLVMMDRASDSGGKKNWVERLTNGMSRSYVLKGFVDSQEFTNVCNNYGVKKGTFSLSEARDKNYGITAFVARCYTQALGRSFDVNGLNNWCSQILAASNKKQKAIDIASNGFFHSQEFKNKNTSNGEYVNILYRTFLGREADSGGYANWVGQLDRGTSRDKVLQGFAYSREFANIMAGYGIT